MRVLITGALGFIGSHLADAYLAAGHEVVGLDDRSGNVVGEIPGALVYRADARSLHPGRAAFKPVDLVVHTASPVGAVALLERTSIVAEIIETTQAVLRFCERGNVPLVNISTSEVYGFSGVYRETDDCRIQHRLTHRIQYAAGKLAAEHLVRTSSVRAISIRPFNVAGPRQSRDKGFVLPTFCEQAIAGEPLTVFGNGLQERSFTAVWDICDFIATAGDWLIRGVEPPEDVFNVGNPHNRTTISALAERVIEAAGAPPRFEFTTGKQVHGPDYEEAVGVVKVPDMTRARCLGWGPKIGLDELVWLTLEEVSGGVQVKAA